MTDAEQLRRYLRTGDPTAAEALYSMAAAIAVFLGASFLLNDSSPSQEPDTPLVAKDKSPAPSTPVHLFPTSESPNLKRIRSARARILKLKERRKRKPASDQSNHHSPSPALS